MNHYEATKIETFFELQKQKFHMVQPTILTYLIPLTYPCATC